MRSDEQAILTFRPETVGTTRREERYKMAQVQEGTGERIIRRYESLLLYQYLASCCIRHFYSITHFFSSRSIPFSALCAYREIATTHLGNKASWRASLPLQYGDLGLSLPKGLSVVIALARAPLFESLSRQ